MIPQYYVYFSITPQSPIEDAPMLTTFCSNWENLTSPEANIQQDVENRWFPRKSELHMGGHARKFHIYVGLPEGQHFWEILQK